MLKDIIVHGIVLKMNHLLVSKEKPTIIFLHDSLGCIDLWRDFPAELGKATNCNVLVYDRQGYGQSSDFDNIERDNDYLESEASVLNAIIEQINSKHVILFGHSDGGSISLIAAAKYPERISAIITEGAHIFVEDITLKGIEDAVKAYDKTDLKSKLEKYHGKKTGALFQAWTKTWLSNKYRSWNIESFLPKITCPVLVIQGENDEFGSIEQVNGIINQVAGEVSKLVIPSVGHNPHKEAKKIVLQRSGLFIERAIKDCVS